jgi:hypothetical protein
VEYNNTSILKISEKNNMPEQQHLQDLNEERVTFAIGIITQEE